MNVTKGRVPAAVFLAIGLIATAPAAAGASQIHTSLADLEAVRIVYPASRHFELGASVCGIGDFDADGYRDMAVGAPLFDPGLLDRVFEKGAIFVIFGKGFDSRPGTIDLSNPSFPGFAVTGAGGAPVGAVIEAVRDVNADGFADFAFTAPDSPSGYLLYGARETDRILSAGELGGRGLTVGQTGHALASAGDFNGDGFPDTLFGNPFSEEVDSNGAKYSIGNCAILLGGKSIPTLLDGLKPGPSLFTWRGLADERYGASLAGGIDLNADGFSDAAILAPAHGPGQTGRVCVIYGGPDPFSSKNATYSFIIEGVKAYVRSTGDVNGDGYPELIAGIDQDTTLLLKGGAHLRGTLDIAKNFDSSWGTLIEGAQGVFHAGDLNGDGYCDIAASIVNGPGAQVDDKILAGRVVFLFGRPQMPAEIDVVQLVKGRFYPIDYIVVDGANAFDNFGASVSSLGDIQGNGFEDVIVGAPAVRLPGDAAGNQPGSAYVIQGVDMYYALQTHRSSFTLQGVRN